MVNTIVMTVSFLKFVCLYLWKHFVSLLMLFVMSVKHVCDCALSLSIFKCFRFGRSGEEDPPTEKRSRSQGRSHRGGKKMRGKRKRSAASTSTPGKGNKKTKTPLEFSASGQTKLEDHFHHRTDMTKDKAQGKSASRESSLDSGGRPTEKKVSDGLATTSTRSPTRNPRRAPVSKSRQTSVKVQEFGLDEDGEEFDAVDGSGGSKMQPGSRTTAKSLKGVPQGDAIPTSSKTRATDVSALPGTSGGSRVNKEEGFGSSDRGKSDHPISDSESDTSSDTQPVTPRKTTTSWFGSVSSALRSPRRQQARTSSPSAWSARDTEAYRNHYPNKKDNNSLNDNWKFYNNEVPSKPRGTFIDKIHEYWFGDHSLLEEHHGYIQWLFPIREMGMNWQSQELQQHEAERIAKDPQCRKRVIKSYELMLHFWGMRLQDERTGEIVRENNWKERFRNLNRSSHNYLRITRMLKSLGELGHEHLKLPFLKFVLREAVVQKTLANAERSCLHYWIHTLRDDREREQIQTYADGLLAGSRY